MNNKKLLVLSVLLSLSSTAMKAEWLEDIAAQVVKKGKWDQNAVVKVVNDVIKHDQARIKELEARKTDPKTGKAAYVGASASLESAKANLALHEKFLSSIEKAKNDVAIQGKLLKSFNTIVSLSTKIKAAEDKDTLVNSAEAAALRAALAAEETIVKGYLLIK